MRPSMLAPGESVVVRKDAFQDIPGVVMYTAHFDMPVSVYMQNISADKFEKEFMPEGASICTLKRTGWDRLMERADLVVSERELYKCRYSRRYLLHVGLKGYMQQNETNRINVDKI